MVRLSRGGKGALEERMLLGMVVCDGRCSRISNLGDLEELGL